MRFQHLYVSVFDNNTETFLNLCTLHIDVHGNGSCVIDTRTGAIMPTIASGDYIYVSASPSSGPFADVTESQFP